MVVDLHGGKIPKKMVEKQFGPDSMTLIMSSGKSIASILLAKMVEIGVLNFDEKISTYWPKFA